MYNEQLSINQSFKSFYLASVNYTARTFNLSSIQFIFSFCQPFIKCCQFILNNQFLSDIYQMPPIHPWIKFIQLSVFVSHLSNAANSPLTISLCQPFIKCCQFILKNQFLSAIFLIISFCQRFIKCCQFILKNKFLSAIYQMLPINP